MKIDSYLQPLKGMLFLDSILGLSCFFIDIKPVISFVLYTKYFQDLFRLTHMFIIVMRVFSAISSVHFWLSLWDYILFPEVNSL